MKIWACYLTYNSADFLRASLLTVIPFVDQVIIVDGKFKEYPGKFFNSTDGTEEIIQEFRSQFPDKVQWIGSYNPNQVEKRNAYLERVPDGDICFVVDADEILLNGEYLRDWIERLYDKYDHIIPIRFEDTVYHMGEDNFAFYPDMERFMLKERLFKKKDGMKYKGWHWNIEYQGTNIYKNEAWMPITFSRYHPRLIHLKRYRSNSDLKPSHLYNILKFDDERLQMLKYHERKGTLKPELVQELYDLERKLGMGNRFDICKTCKRPLQECICHKEIYSDDMFYEGILGTNCGTGLFPRKNEGEFK